MKIEEPMFHDLLTSLTRLRLSGLLESYEEAIRMAQQESTMRAYIASEVWQAWAESVNPRN